MKNDFLTQVRIDVLHEQKHKDGISHIVVGLYLMIIAILGSIGKMNFAVIFIPFIPVLISILKKSYTYPRIGYAEISDKKTSRSFIQIFIAILLILGFGLMLYFQSHSISPAIEKNMHLGIMISIALFIIILLLYRYFCEQNIGFLLYGVIILALIALIYSGILHHNNLMFYIFILGVFDFIFGIIQLLKFMIVYPVMKDEN